MNLPRIPVAFVVLAIFAGCAEPPAVSDIPTVTAGPPPALLPLDDLMTTADSGILDDTVSQSLAARGAALRTRADAITTD